MRVASASSSSRTVRAGSLLVLLPFLFSIGGALGATEPEDFEIFQRLLKEGAVQTAVERGLAYLERHPGGVHRPQVAALVGRSLLEQGRPKEALPLLEEALKGLPAKEHDSLPLDRAEALLDLRRADEAAEALKVPPKGKEAARLRHLRLTARAAEALDDPHGSVRALSALPESRRTEQDRLALARGLSILGRDEPAESLLEGLLGDPGLSDDSKIEASLLLATCRFRLEDADGALQALDSAGPFPDTVRSRAALLRAWTLLALGEAARAYDLVRSHLPLKGWEEAASLAAVRGACLRRDAEATVGAARALLARFPDGPASAEARFRGARSLASQGRFTEALDLLEPGLPLLSDPVTRLEGALLASRMAWEGPRDPARAARWVSLAVASAASEAEKGRTALAAARLAWECGRSADAQEILAERIQAAPEGAAAPGAYLLMGRILLSEGESDRAREVLKIVAEAYPDAPEAREALLLAAESLAMEGRAEDTGGLLAAARVFPLDPSQARRLARLRWREAFARGALEEARLYLVEATSPVRDLGEEDEARYQIALADLAGGRISPALEAIPALADPSRRTALTLRCADALAEGNRTEEALALLKPLLLDSGGEAASLRLFRADLLLQADRLPDALEDLRLAAAQIPAEALAPLAQRRLEMTLLVREGPEAALRAVPPFREAEPSALSEGDALLRQARTRLGCGDRVEAARAYRGYLDRRPKGPGAQEALLFLAREAESRGDFTTVRSLLHASEEPIALLLLGEAAFAQRDMAPALEALERSLSVPGGLTPARALRAHWLAGNAARVLGRTAGAVTHLEAFAAGAQTTPEVREDLLTAALFLEERGRLEAALGAFSRLKAASRDAETGFHYAYALELLERPREALQAYLDVAYTSSSAEWALTSRYRAAELMVRLGRREDAVALYRELASRSEGTVQGDYALRRLAELSPPPEFETAPPLEDPAHAPAPAPR
ncbi:MAG: tetratricopeptide repeat protein [Acidobacteriota bacterium]